ncbi:trypsin-like serine protease [Microbacterium sp. W4I20]|uniref:trypsin-like serine protease n=1 Tax=Microbacterium sp. W4I20 TaxID=3042262 RepID=UPI002788F67E|nr:Ig-like domain-containing protein [Microbacterium sp. W4I20]MDQ0728146.1 hypothetical protein [Microbacterium sp. W4I20]
MKHRGTGRRALALTAAATIALGGLFVATPAYAEDAAETPVASETAAPETAAPETEAPVEEAPAEDAPAEETPVEDAPPAEAVEAADEAAKSGVEIVAFGTNAAGDDVVVVTEESAGDEAAIEAFTDAAGIDGAAVVTVDSAPTTFAEGDVVGGQGYLSVAAGGQAWACSVGFAAWAPDRSPALISAGHCAFNGTTKLQNTTLSIPGEEPAVGGDGAVPANPELLGRFGFAQFGGVNNTAGSNGDKNATDISVIDLEAGFTPLPAVTDWTTAGAALDSLAGKTVAIKAVGAPKAGSVSKSGRTTGFTTGSINGNHVLNGWAKIEDRWVQGFSSNTKAGPGDSGGSVIQGNTAVGLISGGIEAAPGVPQWTWATSLVNALPKTGGYEVALDLAAPTVSSPAPGADVTPGQTITGSAPGAKSVTVDQGAGAQTVAVSGGKFSFAGPVALGTQSISITSVNGLSSSGTTVISVTVKPAPLVAPVITSPKNGSTVTSAVTSISGTGLPTADITVVDGEGAELGTTTVNGTGSWTISGLTLGYGDHKVVVTQSRAGEVSPAATSAFSVVPVAPGVTSLGSGSSFPHDEGPATLSGTGIEGATVTVNVNGAKATSAKASSFAAASGIYTATVTGGKWSVSFGAPLPTGSYSIAVSQSVGGVSSAPTTVTFAVLAAPGTGGGGGGAVTPGDDGNLAATGVDTMVPLTASAVALALLSGGLLLMARRRRTIEA